MELKLTEEDRARLESRTFGPEEMRSAVGAARLGPAIQIEIDDFYGADEDMGVLEVDYAASIKVFKDEHAVSPGNMLGIFRVGVFMCKVHGKIPMDANLVKFAREKGKVGDPTLEATLMRLVLDWENSCRGRFKCGERTKDNPMGKRLVEHGAMIYFNCASSLRDLLRGG